MISDVVLGNIMNKVLKGCGLAAVIAVVILVIVVMALWYFVRLDPLVYTCSDTNALWQIESMIGMKLPPSATNLLIVYYGFDEAYAHMSVPVASREMIVSNWLGHPSCVRPLGTNEIAYYNPGRIRARQDLSQWDLATFLDPVGHGAFVNQHNPRIFLVAIYERNGNRLLLWSHN
jgi:hypothetical protein